VIREENAIYRINQWYTEEIEAVEEKVNAVWKINTEDRW
jgi:hypothetical protein